MLAFIGASWGPCEKRKSKCERRGEGGQGWKDVDNRTGETVIWNEVSTYFSAGSGMRKGLFSTYIPAPFNC